MNSPPLAGAARDLLTRTMTAYRDVPRTASWLREQLERLDKPLCVAVTGRVQSGKSTLLNALAGESLAPTDTTENTQVTTLYRYGPEPRALVETPHGSVQNFPVEKLDEDAIRQLQRWRPDEVSRLVIEYPAPALRAMSLLETAGVASAAVHETGRSALAQILSEADGVLYLTRHPHQMDLQFLQSAHELRTARRAPINTILAVSRADESGNSGAEAIGAAETLAERYRNDPLLRSYVQHVVPVAALLGQAVTTMSEQDWELLHRLRELPENDLRSLLLSADRFAYGKAPDRFPSEHRRQLIVRFGFYGVQRALTSLAEGTADPAQLRADLLESSGMNALQSALHQQFLHRQEALRARSALLAVDMVLRATPRTGTQQLHGELERLLANAHEWDEMRLLSSLDSGQVRFPRPVQGEAKRLLGAAGTDAVSRLGLERDTNAADLADAAAHALARWRERAGNPLHDRPHREALRVALRTCERLTAELHPGGTPAATQ